MQDAKTIYQQFVSQLPNGEKIRLAAIILQNLSDNETKSQSAFDLLQTIENERAFSSSQDVDENLKAERESWEN